MDFIVLDQFANSVFQFFQKPAFEILYILFFIGGWLLFFHLIAFVVLEFYVDYRKDKVTKNWEWVVLAVDLPSANLQTPVAVEQLFSHLAGAYSGPSIEDKYYSGFAQTSFSFEIISIEGYIQFLVRMERDMEDLVRSAIYAQYPDAEITEVHDYCEQVPSEYPDKEYDMWGADFGLVQDYSYPIRTYTEFEHTNSEEIFKDPMSAFLESFSRIGKEEQMWFQILIEPISSSWKEKSLEFIKGLLEGSSKSSPSDHLGDKLVYGINKSLETIGDYVFGREASSASDIETEIATANLTPGQRKVLESMENKISKTGFKTKIRAVYVAKKDSFKPSRGVPALIGAVNQFNNPSSNSLVPKVSTGTSYLFKSRQEKAKKSAMMKFYKKRKIGGGATPYVLNVEELATLWHFPLLSVRTPQIQKSSAKRAEPPVSLPVDYTQNLVPDESEKPKKDEEDFFNFG